MLGVSSTGLLIWQKRRSGASMAGMFLSPHIRGYARRRIIRIIERASPVGRQIPLGRIVANGIPLSTAGPWRPTRRF
jgi:hypothetical protein